MEAARRFVWHNSLSLCFLLLFLGALVGQAFTGWDEFNESQDRHDAEHVSFGRYITSSQFGSAVMENWQSEYLQFTLFILITVWLVQRGSPESKELQQAGRESDEDQQIGEHADARSPLWARAGGARTFLYSNSLLIVMLLIWVGSWFAQSVTSLSEYNEERFSHQQDAVSWGSYLGTSDFWEKTLQNWQSEFLAVGSMAILAVYLRQRGSPESKPVGAPHDATGVEG
jgi:hypothetical protein